MVPNRIPLEDAFWSFPEMPSILQKARDTYTSRRNNIDLFVLQFNKFGGQHIRSELKFPPDFFFQIGLQLAYFRYRVSISISCILFHTDFAYFIYRMFRKQVPTYESVATLSFFHGRTSTARGVSKDSYKFVRAFDDHNGD